MTAMELIDQAYTQEMRERNKPYSIDYKMIAAQNVIEELLCLLRKAIVIGHIDLSDDQYTTDTIRRIGVVLQTKDDKEVSK
jgi:hypothetical protein